jgi:hypothetical protein
VWCACLSLLMFACVCVCVPYVCDHHHVREKLYLDFLNFVCVCACNREGTSHTSSKMDGRLE